MTFWLHMLIMTLYRDVVGAALSSILPSGIDVGALTSLIPSGVPIPTDGRYNYLETTLHI